MGGNLTHEFELGSHEEAIKLFGRNGELRKWVQAETGTRIVDRGAKVVIIGDDEDARLVSGVLCDLLAAVRNGHTPTDADVQYALREARLRGVSDIAPVLGHVPAALHGNIRLKPRTRGQKRYLDAIETHDLTLAIGPAGTGKTFLAMAAAVSALLNKEVNRLILTRPAVEAGESLGFLPGDVEAKVHPYLRPLYDALYDMMPFENCQRYMERGVIEVAPLAFMRGRTLNNSFVVLDEAQNSTREQMKMLLTRLGFDSKAVVTGDITQIDLPPERGSGLLEVQTILADVEGIQFVYLTGEDVVRHELVQRIIEAYEAKASVDHTQSAR